MSGNAIPGVSRLPGSEVPHVFHGVQTLLRARFGMNVEAELTGSSARWCDRDTVGDIDIAVRHPKDRKLDILCAEFQVFAADLGYRAKANVGLGMVHLAYPVHGQFVQVDVMFVDDLPWARFAYWSPVKQSAYKGAHRNILLFNVIRDATSQVIEVGEDGEVATRKRYWFDVQRGVGRGLETRFSEEGKLLKSFRPVYKEFLGKDPDMIGRLAFGCNDGEVWWKADSFESIYDTIMDPKYFRANLTPRMLARTAEALKGHKLETPKELLSL